MSTEPTTSQTAKDAKKKTKKKTNKWLIFGIIIFLVVVIGIIITIVLVFAGGGDTTTTDSTSFPLPAVSGLPTWYSGLGYYYQKSDNDICYQATDDKSIGWVFSNKTDMSFNCQVQYIHKDAGCTGSAIDPNPNTIPIAPNFNSVWTQMRDENGNFKTFYTNTTIECTGPGPIPHLNFDVGNLDPYNSFMSISLKPDKNTGDIVFSANPENN